MLKLTDKDTNHNTITTVFDNQTVRYTDVIIGSSDAIQRTSCLNNREVTELLWQGTLSLNDITYTTYKWKLNQGVTNYKGELFIITTASIPMFTGQDTVMIGLYDKNGYWSESMEITSFNEKINNRTLTLIGEINQPDISISNCCSRGNSTCKIVESHALGKKFFYCRTHQKEVGL